MSVEEFPRHPQLRKDAEAHLRRVSVNSEPVHPSERLLHELRVHQIELEMQNEEIRSAQVELAKMRDRYVDLYEFAPIAYLTLNSRGEITNINQMGVSLLQADRGQLCGLLLEQFVVADDQAMWRVFRELSQVPGRQQTSELRMRRRDGTVFFGCLCAAYFSGEDGLSEQRIALTDISDRKRAEQAHREFSERLSKLTKREREVLALALSGMINQDISAHLRISQRAVENYRSRIHTKTGSVSLLKLSHQAAAAGVTLDGIAKP
jgi:PAS domain S-box-containing protein